MQVLCNPSDRQADIHCPICNRGFRLYWERTSTLDQEATLPSIYQTLRDHHSEPGVEPHPEVPFNIPSWSGLPKFSAAALLGGCTL